MNANKGHRFVSIRSDSTELTEVLSAIALSITAYFDTAQQRRIHSRFSFGLWLRLCRAVPPPINV